MAPSFARFVPTRDGYRDIIFVLMVATLSRIHQHFGFLRPVHPLLLLVVLAGLYAVANPRQLALGAVVRSPTAKLFLAMGVAACISVPFGISMGNSAVFILTEFSKVLLFAFLVLVGIRDSRDLYKFVWAFVAAAGFLAWLSIFVFRMRAAKGEDFVRIQNGYSYDSNDIGVVANLGLVLTLLAFQVAKGRARVLCGLLILCLGMTIAKTGSRGAFLTLGVVVVGLLFTLKNVSMDKKIGFLLAVGFGLFLSAPKGYWDQMMTIVTPTQDYNWTSKTGRKEVAMRGLGYMMMNPATGIGINNFGRAEGMISDRAVAFSEGSSDVGVKWSAAHNSFVEVAAETGLFGFSIFCLIVFGSIYRCYHIRQGIPPGWSKGDQEQQFLYYCSVYFPVAFMAFAVGGALVSFGYLDPIYVLAAFVGGLQTAVAKRKAQENGLSGLHATAAVGTLRRRFRGGLPPSALGPALPPPLHPPVVGV